MTVTVEEFYRSPVDVRVLELPAARATSTPARFC